MTPPIRNIVVGASTVLDADPILPSAVALARRLGARLHAVHAYDLPSPIQLAYAREMFLDQAMLDRYGEDLRGWLEGRVRAAAEGVDAVCHAVEGSASECLCEVAREVDADLLVVGASRGSRVWRQFLGTTAEGVIRCARCPVLVLRRPLPDPVRRVLLTTDLGDTSAETQHAALAVVRDLFGAAVELRCLLVVQDDTMPLEFRRETVSGLAERELRTFLAGRVGAGEAVEARVRVGAPVEEILTEASEWQADLLVVGAHGRRRGMRYLLGSVAGATLRASPDNVLVVPVGARAARRAGAREAMDDALEPLGFG